MINPVNHTLDQAAADRYRVEPYVVAADIYSVGALAGRGGWTWYTGSAGWLYRCAVEGILGIRKQGRTISLKPALPTAWNHYAATLRLGDATYRISVERAPGADRLTLEIDGRKLAGSSFDLIDKEGPIEVKARVP
jgi:cyclic beta-1,2-glucan synthetase